MWHGRASPPRIIQTETLRCWVVLATHGTNTRGHDGQPRLVPAARTGLLWINRAARETEGRSHSHTTLGNPSHCHPASTVIGLPKAGESSLSQPSLLLAVPWLLGSGRSGSRPPAPPPPAPAAWGPPVASPGRPAAPSPSRTWCGTPPVRPTPHYCWPITYH